MNFTDKIFGGGARLSGRLSKIETHAFDAGRNQGLVDTMGKIADMRERVLSAEQDIRELRHGDGWVKPKIAAVSMANIQNGPGQERHIGGP